MVSPCVRDKREQRGSIRFDTRLPVRVGNCVGELLDVSAQGVCFELGVRPPLGMLVEITVLVTRWGRRHPVRCEGKIIRVDRRGRRAHVAARLVVPFFLCEEQAEA